MGMTDTQLEAFEAIKPHRATLQEKVFAFIRENDGATDEQIRNGLGMIYGSACARRKELEKQGRVANKGRRAVSSSGRNVIVWEVA